MNNIVNPMHSPMHKEKKQWTVDNIGYTDFYKRLTEYQRQIVLDMILDGAKIQCTEGTNYKTWLTFPDGTERKVRRDSSNIVCNSGESKFFIFGEYSGIRIK